MTLNISTAVCGEVAILKCEGRVTLGEGASFLRDQVKAALRGGARHIVMNLAEVHYIDSSGIGELVGAFVLTKNSGGDLVLAGLRARMMDLLRLTKLSSVFTSFETTEAALAFLAPTGRVEASNESSL